MHADRTVVCRNSAAGTYVEVPAAKLQFRPAVYGVIVRDGHILLSQFADGWLLPGGGIDQGETIEDALRREIDEETGLSVTRGELLHFEEDFVQGFLSANYFHTFRWYYLCSDPRGDLSADGFTEFEKAHMQPATWLSFDDALAAKIHHPIDPQELIRSAIAAAGI